jgi:hypothetical protein
MAKSATSTPPASAQAFGAALVPETVTMSMSSR